MHGKAFQVYPAEELHVGSLNSVLEAQNKVHFSKSSSPDKKRARTHAGGPVLPGG